MKEAHEICILLDKAVELANLLRYHAPLGHRVQLEAGAEYAALQYKTLVSCSVQLALEASWKQDAAFGVHTAFIHTEYGIHGF